MTEALEQAQAVLDSYNEKWGYEAQPYQLARKSKHHPSAHVVQFLIAFSDSVCGVGIHQSFAEPPDEKSKVCSKCERWLDRVSR